MFYRNFVQVLNIIWLRSDVCRSLRVLVKELTSSRLYCAITPVLQIISLKQCLSYSHLLWTLEVGD